MNNSSQNDFYLTKIVINEKEAEEKKEDNPVSYGLLDLAKQNMDKKHHVLPKKVNKIKQNSQKYDAFANNVIQRMEKARYGVFEEVTKIRKIFSNEHFGITSMLRQKNKNQEILLRSFNSNLRKIGQKYVNQQREEQKMRMKTCMFPPLMKKKNNLTVQTGQYKRNTRKNLNSLTSVDLLNQIPDINFIKTDQDNHHFFEPPQQLRLKLTRSVPLGGEEGAFQG